MPLYGSITESFYEKAFRELPGIVLKREEAISVPKELDNCTGLDEHYLELASPITPASTVGGYQIIIGKALDEKTRNCIQSILMKNQLVYQEGSLWKTKRSKDKEPDAFIIYKPKYNVPAVTNPLRFEKT